MGPEREHEACANTRAILMVGVNYTVEPLQDRLTKPLNRTTTDRSLASERKKKSLCASLYQRWPEHPNFPPQIIPKLKEDCLHGTVVHTLKCVRDTNHKLSIKSCQSIDKSINLAHSAWMFKKYRYLNSLRVFEVAARNLSFTKAAEELYMSQGAVSYQIRELETRLSLKLFRREIRQVSLTDAGERLYKVTRRALIDIDSEITALTSSQDMATLTIAASTYFTTRWLSKPLTQFLNTHPDMALQLQHSVNTPDFKVGKYDLAIRWGKPPWEGVISRELMPMPMMPVCSPDLLKGHNTLQNHPISLASFTLLRDQENVDLWPDWLRKAGVPEEAIIHSRVIADPVVRTQAALDGQGIMLADGLVDAELENGSLITPFDINLEGYGYHVLWDETVELSPASVQFLGWLMTQA